MSKILVSFPGDFVNGKYYYYSFYEGLLNALCRNGNQVLYMIANDFLQDYSSRQNICNKDIDKTKLDNYLKSENIDLVIAFNNIRYENLHQVLECPFVVWGVDSFPFYFDKDKLKESSSRFIIFGNNEEDTQTLNKELNSNKIELLRFATDVRADTIDDGNKINIIFIGRYWDNLLLHNVRSGNLTIEQVKILDKVFRKDLNATTENAFGLAGVSPDFCMPKTAILHSIATADRESVLLGICDLGLNLYGQGWEKAHYKLVLNFIPRIVYSEKDLSSLFNNSRICFNMSHLQAGHCGFSFRLLDGMASSACLVTDYKPIYDKIFGYKNLIPTYKYGDSHAAYNVCKYILDNEDIRLNIVKESHKVIESNFRFEHRFKTLEDFTGVSLLNSNDTTKGTIQQISKSSFIKVKNQSYSRLKRLGFMSTFLFSNKNFTYTKKLTFKSRMRYCVWKYLDQKLRKKGIVK